MFLHIANMLTITPHSASFPFAFGRVFIMQKIFDPHICFNIFIKRIIDFDSSESDFVRSQLKLIILPALMYFSNILSVRFRVKYFQHQ